MDQPTPHPAPPGPEAQHDVCARCGTRAPDGAPPTWTCSVENGTRQYFCVDCARANLRAIEGRLDSAWW
ncbi:hypothetical protein ACWGHM_10635 [Streptomyces sp. NPDC054904]|uniref:hypothetical protein n=1 Tax=unclassified Streptomyces TaxID=2593676 RepID=UPI002481FD2D|nr:MULTISPECIES: hypothetical protein [unclassified Streptomyces]MDA5286155.1 hypothetical protein [Streptomyces sp. Isolate_45]MDX2389910.1 hypothetical protein [Streptomyces sp. DK15]